MNQLLTISHLHKHYGTKQILANISLQVGIGECFGLLGKNGSGKSTLIDCILGLKTFNSGNITLLNQSPDDYTNHFFTQVGVQFQDSHYPEKMKVNELCELYEAYYKATSKTSELLKSFDLLPIQNRFISQLSGGEKQRLALAMTLIGEPQIVFLDELTTGLDPIARRQVWQYLDTMKKKGLSFFLTSHYMDEVSVLCDRIAILNHGRIVATGSVQQVIDQAQAKSLEEAYLYFMEETNNENA